MAKKKEMAIASTTGVDVPALVISPGKAVAVTGNFDQIEAYLIQVRDKYAGVELSTANLEDVQRIKSELRTYRTSVEKIEKSVKADYFNNPKKVFEGNISRLYAIIAEVESRADTVLAAEDEKRIDQINQAIDLYIKNAMSDMPLEEAYQARIERKKAYYNKTQDELETRNDINAQVLALYKAQKADIGNRKLIEKSCAGDKRLSSALFLEMLENGEDVAGILEKIDAEKLRLNQIDMEGEKIQEEKLDNPPARPEEDEAEEEDSYEDYLKERDGEIVEEVKNLDYAADMPKRRKTVTVEIDYPMECGNVLTKVFEILHSNGIKSKIIKA